MKKILLVASSLLLSTQVHAAPGCKASDLNGNYVMYQAAINKNFHTGRCEIQILNGNATGTCEFDPAVDGSHNFHGPVSGPAVINTNCSATLELDFHPNPSIPEFTIVSNFNLQFTPDKQSFIGKFVNSFDVQGTTSGTRYSPLLPATPAL